jgi:Protein of unknown function (DUF551).
MKNDNPFIVPGPYRIPKRTASRWVKTDERLPKDGESVLVVYESPSMGMEVAYYSRDRADHMQEPTGWCNSSTHDDIHCIPTHWMPLPDAP